MKRTEPYSRLYKTSKAARVRLYLDRVKQFFRLPACYRRMRAIRDCKRSGLGLARDLLELFFSHKTFPNHYGLCRLWEVERSQWESYYHFTLYSPHHKARLQRTVQPYVYRILFDDKFLCAMQCQAMGIRTPHTYGTIDPGQDYRARIQAWLQAPSAPALFIKPIFGSGGRDIVVASKIGSDVVVSSATTSLPLRSFALRERSIVQARVTQDSRMAAVAPSSLNTIRMVTMLTKRQEAIVVGTAIRFGVGESIVDNFSAGGVSVGLDAKTGKLRTHGFDKKGKSYTAHPTTGVVFGDFVVPEWPRVCQSALEVQKAFSFYRLMGLDLGIDERGEPVVVEINGSPDLVWQEQMSGPLFKSEAILRAFGEDNLFVNKHQRKLYARLEGGGER